MNLDIDDGEFVFVVGASGSGKSTFIRKFMETLVLPNIENEFNAVVLNGDSVGEVSFVGKGAGKLATGSAVYGDVMDILNNRISSIDSFTKEKVDVNKVLDENCSALLRFESNHKDEIFNVLKEKVSNYDILNEDEELAVLVYANSEFEINDILSEIQNKGYCSQVNKLIKIN